MIGGSGQDHDTESIPMKMIDVDVGIIPVVNWLNSMQGVYTEWSCQGDADKTEYGSIPYVRFVCTSPKKVDEIEEVLLRTSRLLPVGEYVSISQNRNYYNGRIIELWDIHFSGKVALSHLLSMISSRTSHSSH